MSERTGEQLTDLDDALERVVTAARAHLAAVKAADGALDDEAVSGVVNATAPNPVTNREFDGDTWHDRERARVTAWVDHLYDDPLAPVVLGRLGGDAETAAIETQRLRKAIEVGARNVARGQRDGDLLPGRDPELLVAAILGGVHMAVVVALTRTPRPDRSRVAAELWAFVAGAAGAANTSGRTS